MSKRSRSYEQETIINSSKETQAKSHQSWGEIIQYLDGMAFGIAPDGRTICLGNESDIREILSDASVRSNSPIINDIIDTERQLIKQREGENGRQPELKRPSAFRGRPVGDIKHREADIRRSSVRKRTAVYKT